jgi:hypothetical protein
LGIANWELKITNVGGAVFYALLAQRNHGSNLMRVVFGQPFRVGERAKEEFRGHRSYRGSQRLKCHPLVYEVAS